MKVFKFSKKLKVFFIEKVFDEALIFILTNMMKRSSFSIFFSYFKVHDTKPFGIKPPPLN